MAPRSISGRLAFSAAGFIATSTLGAVAWSQDVARGEMNLEGRDAEIRAPAGTLAGVSAFQIHFASRDILTPGDTPNVLVAMNPAALKANLPELERGATIIVNEDAFTKRNLREGRLRRQPARGRHARAATGSTASR